VLPLAGLNTIYTKKNVGQPELDQPRVALAAQNLFLKMILLMTMPHFFRIDI
jgi:hypothetical protein